eukprot:6206167-Pleurochrysis_carterae.AAC.4
MPETATQSRPLCWHVCSDDHIVSGGGWRCGSAFRVWDHACEVRPPHGRAPPLAADRQGPRARRRPPPSAQSSRRLQRGTAAAYVSE